MPSRRRKASSSEEEEENFDPNEMEEGRDEEQRSSGRPKRGQKGQQEVKKQFEASDSRPGRKRVMLIEESVCENKKLELIRLRHPGTGSGALFLVDPEVKVIKEVTAYKEENRSWFVDQTIESDGKIFVTTDFDPLLLLIPHLSDPQAMLTPLDQLVDDPEFPAIKRIAASSAMTSRMKRIADPKGTPDLNVWKYNEEKTLKYLGSKVKRVAAFLRSEGVNIQGGSISGNFVKSAKATEDEAAYLRYAHGVVAAGLSEDLAEKLRENLKIPKDKPAKKREPAESLAPAAKKAKTGAAATPTEDYSKSYKKPATKETPKNAKQKALAKSASGSKSITSFFTKK